MVKKSDMSKAPRPEPVTPAPEVETPEPVEREEVKVEVTVEPKIEVTVSAADMKPIAEAIKEMATVEEVEDKKPKKFKVTVTKRAFNSLIEEFVCEEIT